MASVFRGDDNFDTAGGNAVKAWVNFNGTGTVAIRASYNVTSITDNGTGDYTVNFTNALSDANYAFTALALTTGAGNSRVVNSVNAYNVASIRFTCGYVSSIGGAGTVLDIEYVNAAIFR